MGDLHSLSRRSFLASLAITAVGPSTLLFGQSSKSVYGERTVEPQLNPDDREGIWTLHFRFKDPRILITEVPGRGRKVVWYLWYQVYNLTGEPRLFVPEIELVTLDPPTVHTDEVLPSVQEQINKLENPGTRPELTPKNSVTMFKDLIPVSKKDAFPRAITGVAIWTSVHEKARDMNKFAIYVAGLSDGYTRKGDDVYRKTLRLDFQRTSGIRRDGTDDASDIKFIESSWVYRGSSKGAPAPVPKKEDSKKEEKVDATLPPLNEPPVLPTRLIREKK